MINATRQFPLFTQFTSFIEERHLIYRRRKDEEPAPWTKDPILATYRFCNVYREYDRVTRWIAKFWRKPHLEHVDLWFAMVIARLVNHPDTLAQMGYPMSWNPDTFLQAMHSRQREGLKTFGSAYIVSTNGQSMDKAVYLAVYVLGPMWEQRKLYRPKLDDTLSSYYDRLIDAQGMGTFMAAQVIADLKYAPPLDSAKDWWTFAASGPGSRRGMSYLMGRDPRSHWKEQEWRDALKDLSRFVRPVIFEAGMPRLHNQDLQNCLCEFSKYRRTQLGTGKPKQKFTPYIEGA